VFPKLHSQEPRLAAIAALAFALAFAFSGLGCVMPPCKCSQPPVAAAPPAVTNAQPTPPSPKPGGWREYLVQPGDTLARIAACRGVSVDEIVRENAIYDRNRILVGWSLRVPAEDLCAGRDRIAELEAPKRAAPRSHPRASQTAAAPPAAAPSPAVKDTRAQQLLDSARADYDAALFDAALRDAEAAAQEFARAPRGAETDTQRANAHLLAAMAAAGLEDRERALAEFERAFALDPEVRLAPEDQSPRLLELFQLARGRRAERVR